MGETGLLGVASIADVGVVPCRRLVPGVGGLISLLEEQYRLDERTSIYPERNFPVESPFIPFPPTSIRPIILSPKLDSFSRSEMFNNIGRLAVNVLSSRVVVVSVRAMPVQLSTNY